MYRQVAVMLFIVFLAAPPVKAQVQPPPPAETLTESQESQTQEITAVIVDGNEYSLEEFEKIFGDQPLQWGEDPEAETQGKLVAFTMEDPANANSRSVNKRCETKDNGFILCPTIFTTPSPRTARAEATIDFEENATRATACKLTVWVILIKGGQEWTFGRKTVSCTEEMRNPVGRTAKAVTPTTGSTATFAAAKACVDLYYNGSNHSGFQYCQQSLKVGFFLTPQ